MVNIGLPKISVTFAGLGVSAVERGSRGVACIIIKDDTDTTFNFAEYQTVADLTSEETAKFTEANVRYIKDCLLGTPSKVIVARMATSGTLADLLAKINGKQFDWIGLAEGTAEEQTELSTYVKTAKNKIKAVTYQTDADSDHVVNFANDTVTYTDKRATVAGDKYISRIIGVLAGMPLTMSAIAYKFSDLECVSESEDLEGDINSGKLMLINDEGSVKVARAVNSLTTTGEGITDDFKYILMVETMDLIYKDIVSTWKNNYEGRYKNDADNQYLLISAINAYFKSLELDGLLDENYNNVASIDVTAQRLANVPKYGSDVNTWDDNKVAEMTVGTQVYLTANIKILNAMEDFSFGISL